MLLGVRVVGRGGGERGVGVVVVGGGDGVGVVEVGVLVVVLVVLVLVGRCLWGVGRGWCMLVMVLGLEYGGGG